MLENSFTDTIKQVTTDDCSICIMSITDPKKGYCNLNLQDKAKLLEINGSKYLKKQIHRYDTILISLTIPQDLKAISKIIHLKPKYTRKYIRKLEILNFIECSKGKYHSIIEI